MKTVLTMVASSLVLFSAAGASAQDEAWWNGAPDAPQQQAPAVQAQPVPQNAPVAPPQPQQQAAEPPQQAAPQVEGQAPQAAEYPGAPVVTGQMASQGEWVYTDQYGWTWVPYGSTATTVGADPYVYLYAPAYGWTWFASPWGFGPFRYGSWGWGPRWGRPYVPHAWGAGHYYAPRVWVGGRYVAPRGFVGGGVRYAPGVHYAPRVGVGVHYGPAYGGARYAPAYGGAHYAPAYGGAHYGGAAHFGGGGGAHFGGGGGAHFGGGGGAHFGGGGGHGGHR